jgi:hypothetical protein
LLPSCAPLDAPIKEQSREARAAELRERIAKLEASLAVLRNELAILEPQPLDASFQPESFDVADMSVGKRGPIRNAGGSLEVSVHQVLGPEEFLATVPGRSQLPDFIVKGLPTRDLADGKRLRIDRQVEVTGTRHSAGSTYYVVEVGPYD